MSQISRDEVAHLARLALALTDGELDSFAGQLDAILGHVSQIQAVDVTGVAATDNPLKSVNVFRPDEPQPCLTQDEALAQAPNAVDGRFAVPRILGSPNERHRPDPARRRHAGEKIAAGEVSSTEVTQACLDQIAATDGEYHAFLHVAGEQALAAAADVDKAIHEAKADGEPPASPLAGVPLALKDVFTTADMPTTCGSKILEGGRRRTTRR